MASEALQFSRATRTFLPGDNNQEPDVSSRRFPGLGHEFGRPERFAGRYGFPARESGQGAQHSRFKKTREKKGGKWSILPVPIGRNAFSVYQLVVLFVPF